MNNIMCKIDKTFLMISLLVFFYGCNSSSGSDCFQAAGDNVTMIMNVASFSKLRTEGEVTLFIKQGDVQEVSLTTGENLLSDITVTVEGETLILRDTNACNFVRDYGVTIVTVTTPNLTSIRNAANYDIRSIGALNFPVLQLSSNTDGGLDSPKKTGDFYLDIVSDELRISANGQSVFYMSGTAAKARVSFLDENPRFEGRNLLVNEFNFFQRSANKMIVNPLEKLTGSIVSTGDVISVNRPPIVEVEIGFTGELIFE